MADAYADLIRNNLIEVRDFLLELESRAEIRSTSRALIGLKYANILNHNNLRVMMSLPSKSIELVAVMKILDNATLLNDSNRTLLIRHNQYIEDITTQLSNSEKPITQQTYDRIIQNLSLNNAAKLISAPGINSPTKAAAKEKNEPSIHLPRKLT